MFAEFQSECLTDTKSGSGEQREQDLITAFRPCQNLLNFRCGKRWFALFLFVYDWKADEVEIPITWMARAFSSARLFASFRCLRRAFLFRRKGDAMCLAPELQFYAARSL